MAIKVRLAWEYTEPCDGFNIYRKVQGGSYGSALASGPFVSRTYDDAAVAYGTTYVYGIKAYNVAGESVIKEVTVTVVVPVPEQVPTFTASVVQS